MDFLPARTSPSLIFSKVAPVADFAPGYASRWFFSGSHVYVEDFLLRLRISLTFFPGRARCWLLFQIAHIADFFPGRARRWLFPRLRMPLIFFRVAREYVDDLLLSLRTTLTSFPSRARCWFFPSLRTSLISFSDWACRWLLFHRSRQSKTFFSCCSCRCYFFSKLCLSMNFCQLEWVLWWLLFQVAPDADFFPGRARRWLFPWWRMPLIFFPGRTSTSMTSFLGCAHHWLFSLVAPVADFQIVPVNYLFFTGRASRNFFFSCWICRFDFFSSCAYRWTFCQLARVIRWLLSQVAPVADFSPVYERRWSLFPCRTIPSVTSFSDCACQWLLFHRSRQSQPFFHIGLAAVIFFQVVLIDGFFASSHESFADFFFRLRL